MSDWKLYLANRGIQEDTIRAYRLAGGTYDNRPSVRLTVITPAGEIVHRHKFIDGEKPKIKWEGKLNGQPRYYSAGGLAQAIKQHDGTLYWLSGEPDVWTYHAVTGRMNATCTFGEGSVPKTVAADLRALGVDTVVMYPDLDDAGMQAARKLYAALKGSGITLKVKQLPGEMGSKRDLNDVWKSVGADKQKFYAVTMAAVELGDDDLREPDTALIPADIGAQAAESAIDFGQLFEDWIDEIVTHLGAPMIREGSVNRWHCPLPGHEDKHPSFRISDGTTTRMPMCSCNIQSRGSAREAWNEVAKAVGFIEWADYRNRKAPVVNPWKAEPAPAPQNGASATPSIVSDMSEYIRTSEQVASDLMDLLTGDSIPEVDYIPFPLRSLHRFGGFAEVMSPGKLIYIVGVSGGGKTSLAEVMGGAMLRGGYDFVWFGPEWSPLEMGLRELQRAGGPPMLHMNKYAIWMQEEAKGVPKENRRGVPLSDAQMSKAIGIVADMLSWPGTAHWMTEKTNALELDALLDMMKAHVRQVRSEGRRVGAFFFDYLQRAKMRGRDSAFWSEEIVDKIKSACEEVSVVGFVLIQPKKGDSKATRDGEQLSQDSGQGISDQKCNLYLAVTPDFDSGKKFGTVKIVKNSMGETGEVVLESDFSRLLWKDKPMTVQTTTLREVT